MVKIYHNPKCRKSREGLAYLMQKGYEFEMIRYLEKPFSFSDLKKIFMKLNIKPIEGIRNQEEIFRKELKGKHFTDDEWIHIIMQNPQLLQRPIVEGKYRAVIAVPAERIEEVVKQGQGTR
jgi:arsenate reductase (glutaredoxin)